jgi:hypothetical protein
MGNRGIGTDYEVEIHHDGGGVHECTMRGIEIVAEIDD